MAHRQHVGRLGHCLLSRNKQFVSHKLVKHLHEMEIR